jgi:hypothetical protein
MIQARKKQEIHLFLHLLISCFPPVSLLFLRPERADREAGAADPVTTAARSVLLLPTTSRFTMSKSRHARRRTDTLAASAPPV